MEGNSDVTIREAIEQAESMKKRLKVGMKQNTPRRRAASYVMFAGYAVTTILGCVGMFLTAIGCAGLLEAVLRGGDLIGFGVFAIAGAAVSVIMMAEAAALCEQYEVYTKPPVMDNLKRLLSELGFAENDADE